MNEDRELLELAAKAAGYEITGWNTQGGVDVAVLNDGSYWQPLLKNPITDFMGDALRLAVKLNISIYRPVVGDSPEHWGTIADSPDQQVSLRVSDRIAASDNPEAATSSAIVRAAAEIGKAMP